jgi:uncharacterized membrane protein YtjA (UPF0391 family)
MVSMSFSPRGDDGNPSRGGKSSHPTKPHGGATAAFDRWRRAVAVQEPPIPSRRFGCKRVKSETSMLSLLILLVIVAIVAGALGFTGIAAGAAGLAKILFFIMVAGVIIVLALVLFGVAAIF